jgi:hypothetical protein
VCAAVALLAAPAGADVENDAVGFSPNHVFERALAGEHIDLLSGNLNLTIPLGPTFQVTDGLSYQLTLYYNSKIWEHMCRENLPPDQYCPGSFPVRDDWGLGFDLGFGRIYRREAKMSGSTILEPKDKTNVYRYRTPDGAEHLFFADSSCKYEPCGATNHQVQSLGGTGTPGGVGGYVTLDGTGIRVTGSAASGWVVYPGNGTRLIFNKKSTTTDPLYNGWYPTRIETVRTITSIPA